MLTDMTLGQYYPGDSFLHRMDPRAKILCTMIFIIAIFLANNPFSYLLVAAFTLGAISVSGVPYKLVWRAVKPLWFILLFTLAIHVFTTPGTELFSWKFIHISEEGIRNGVEMTLRLVFLIAFTSLLTYTTSPIVLTDGIEALLMPFKRIGVPAHELAMMMTIALRFIPTLLEETDRIMKARALYPLVKYTEKDLYTIATLTASFKVDGHRADLVILRTARAQAAFDGRTQITDRDILLAAELALPHRMKKQPFQDSIMNPDQLQQNMRQARAEAEQNASESDETMQEDGGQGTADEKKA